ncbi:phosphotransferase family protein [Deinococcus roseus]|uniref:Aminoglycoside phosphotransferase domain-containing protein n=1 Tax=Deinococcus roseus TaxID=392414 RepID=A0ABQ2DB05_9DEIO|nr:aminoglycoside phosphotransferase family protein [Deinococcus roseus]GGJ50873.1 hypothetical protein GCM10008938_41110 [Deinococcus roseus]
MSSLEIYLQVIREGFPDLQLQNVEFNRDGLCNDVVIVDQEWVFRFGQDDWARNLFSQEARVLELLKGRLNVALPHLEAQTSQYVMHRYLKGTEFTRAALLSHPVSAREKLLDQLGEMLHQLHSIPFATLDQQGIGRSPAFRDRDWWIRFYQELENELFDHLNRYQRSQVAAHFEPVLSGTLPWSSPEVLIHCDITSYHLLYDPEKVELCGLLDFGVAGKGDPATDVAVLLQHWGESVVSRISKTYPMWHEVIDRARFWMGTLEYQWALSALRGDQSMRFVHLGNPRDVYPVGHQG